MHDDDEHDDELENPEGFEGVYIVDEDTLRLIEVVVGMVHMLGNTQVDENARENCFAIAGELADRFGVSDGESIEVEEIIHGDEVLYKPRGGVMGDEPIEPSEAESPNPEG